MVRSYPEPTLSLEERSADKQCTLACNIGRCYAITFKWRKLVSATVWSQGKKSTTERSSFLLSNCWSRWHERWPDAAMCVTGRDDHGAGNKRFGFYEGEAGWDRRGVFWSPLCKTPHCIHADQLGNKQSNYNHLLENKQIGKMGNLYMVSKSPLILMISCKQAPSYMNRRKNGSKID